jgi:hypothetical protein
MCVVILNTLRYLCERDCKAFAALFQLLDQQQYISYNDFNGLSSKIMHNGVHLPQVLNPTP